MLVHSKEVQEPWEPEYDVNAVEKSSHRVERRVTPPKAKTYKKQARSHSFHQVPVLANP